MRQGLTIGLIVSALLVSGMVAFSVPSRLFPTDSSGGSEVRFDCEDLVDGDRVEIREESAGERIEIRVEADTRVRAEARFERTDGSDVRREARLDICGFVQFVDANGDGLLDPADKIVRSDLAEFGPISHRLAGNTHLFQTTTAAGEMTVTLVIPATFPEPGVSLVNWTATASPACDPIATHFAIKLEEEEPVQRDRFFAAKCGTTLVAPDGTTPPPARAPFECQALVQGSRFEVTLAQEDGEFQRLDARIEADTRVRADVRLETGNSEPTVQRESRVELCGFLMFADEDGDGAFGPSDTVISTTLAAFDGINHTVVGGMHVFQAVSEDANLTLTIRVPATFPAADHPLLEWFVFANPTCDPGATHYAVKLEQEAPAEAEEFLVAACGTPLNAMGEA